MAELTEAGCVGFSQADVALRDTLVLHARAAVRRDLRLHGLAAAEGRLARQRRRRQAARWRRGWACPACRCSPRRSRWHTIFELVRDTGARVHLCRLSQRRRRRAGARGQGRGPAGDLRRQHQLAAPDRRRHRLLQRRDAADAAAAPAARPRRDPRRRWPTARSTRWSATTRRSTRTPRHLPFAEAEPGATGLELLLSLALKWGDDAGLGAGADARDA